MNFSQFALAKFGNFVKRHNNYLIIRGKLRSAHIFKPYEEYVSEALIVSLIVAISGLIIGLVVGIILAGRINIPPMLVYDPDVARILNIFSPFKKYTLIALVGIVGSAFLGGIVYTIFMIYPSFQASIRKVKIDTQLPYAVMYMYALSRGETNIIEIIRSVAELPNVYGEISNEFAMILRDSELLGIDFMNALRNLQKETPSQNLNQFLGNLITLIDNGGDVTDFLEIQIDNYRTKTKSEHTLFLDMLGMIAETYVTGFVAGPLFMIIVAATLGSMKGSMTFLLMGLTYAVLPFGSIGFVLVVDMMLPKDEQVIGTLNLRKVAAFVGLRKIEKPAGQEQKLFEEYENSKRRIHFENIMKNPLRAFFEEPELSLYITVPVALLIIAFSMISNPGMLFKGYAPASGYFTNYILLALMVALLPYIVFFEARSRKLWNIENAIPQFLKNLSIINETGLSLAESLRVMLRTERGALREHVERMYTDISWGASTTDAFIRFSNKIKTNTLSRVVALITKASESSGDIREVLNIAATDSNINLQLKKDKSTNMLIYVIIIYIAFLVFLYVVYTLATTFLPQMAKGAQAGGSTFIRNFNLEFYKVYFYHTALIQAFFSGMMAGVLGEGNPKSGLKHSVILMFIAYLAFTLLVK
ncbi:Type II secretion system (T2SS), protein F [uncultured archaeon]|nr:Type II secretion system (T2SS), protein F [uncultured archaeon]